MNKENKVLINSAARIIVTEIIPTRRNVSVFDLMNLRCKDDFPKELYLVALAENQKVFHYAPTIVDIASWIENVFDIFCKYGAFIGGRKGDSGFYFLNTLIPVTGFDRAIISAKSNNQIVIYYPHSNTFFNINQHG